MGACCCSQGLSRATTSVQVDGHPAILLPRSPAGRSTRGEVIKQTVVERWRPLFVEMVTFGEDLVRLFDDSWMQE